MVNFLKRIFFQELPAPETRTIVIKKDSIGTTGTQNYAGYTAEEYLAGLANSRLRADKFDQMRRSDPQIKMLLSAIKSPIKGAKWEVRPYTQDDPNAEADAELIEFLLFEAMDKTWAQFVSEAMTLVDFGHSVFEIIDGVKESKEFGMVNCVKDLSFRSQRTIERWNLDRETNCLKSITQIANGDLSSFVDIPAEFLTVFSLEKEGSNYEGISALRPIYGNWFRKNYYLKMNAIGIERFAIPTPVATVPTGKEGTAEFDNMQLALESFTGHEKSYLTMPDGWKLELHSNAYDPSKVEISIDNEDKRMVKAFLAGFLELGLNGSGSHALAGDVSDFFLRSIEYVADIICAEINQKLIPRMIKLNRGERPGYPYLKVSGITDKVGSEFSITLKNFFDSKILTPDDKLEEFIREKYNLPEMSLEGQRQATPPPSPFGAPQIEAPTEAEPVDQEEKEVESPQIEDAEGDLELSTKISNPALFETIKRIYG